MDDILIDLAGETWDVHSPALRARYQTDVSSTALPDFLVRNHGYIRMVVSSDTLAVRGAPSRVSYATLAELTNQIETLAPRRCALSWFNGQWHHEVFPDPNRIRTRLLDLMLQSRESNQQRYLLQPRALSTLPATHRYARLLAFWKERAGYIDLQADGHNVTNVTNGKFLLVGPDQDSGVLKFSAIGPGNEMYRDKGWANRFNNGPVEVQPDIRFGAWIANGYRDTLAALEPQLTDIDAVVHDPRCQITRHYTFSRLLLPIWTKDGATRLLSAPLADSGIRLGIEPQEKVHRIIP